MPYIDFQQLTDLEQTITDQPAITWESVGRSDAGRVRNANEDAFYHSTDQGIWAVADGMGGLARGDYASGVVAEAFVHFGKSSSLAASIRDLEIRLRAAHSDCRSSFEGERVGSTVAAMLSYGQYSFFLWAGDSRVYRLRGNQLRQMTKDHTVAQQKFERGELSANKVARHPDAHVLTRAVGVHQTLHLDLDYETVEKGDRFLICSDGLYNDLARAEIQQYLESADAQMALDALIDSALEKGGSDNITAIVIDAA
ncbi:MAG: serine/threonine-protein phosphatase [Oceanicoccus sp.]|uniref:PP2C family protein-serine/threonine phosphatase n=1 Tax=Oceanicoccus sp. TaxID=2691044 RepID=UPI0026088469|nr:protein phosphatase 2C domain-containing protein [Oceanicoccus sp.]MCP3908400.1 serine/threonine-protein phosphatase [Oceanicoccus sp.]MDG1773964.1 protein phosphatase 2C domain-containing protein [Oceanicoccus sp.]